jgi:hypothetical protein
MGNGHDTGKLHAHRENRNMTDGHHVDVEQLHAVQTTKRARISGGDEA